MQNAKSEHNDKVWNLLFALYVQYYSRAALVRRTAYRSNPHCIAESHAWCVGNMNAGRHHIAQFSRSRGPTFSHVSGANNAPPRLIRKENSYIPTGDGRLAYSFGRFEIETQFEFLFLSGAGFSK